MGSPTDIDILRAAAEVLTRKYSAIGDQSAWKLMLDAMIKVHTEPGQMRRLGETCLRIHCLSEEKKECPSQTTYEPLPRLTRKYSDR